MKIKFLILRSLGIPGFVTLDEDSGVLSGTPTYGNVGVHPNIRVSVRSAMAADVSALESSEDFFIHIKNVNDKPESRDIEIEIDEGGHFEIDLSDDVENYVSDEESSNNVLIYSLKDDSTAWISILRHKSQLIYTHGGGENTVDTFTYYVSDGAAFNSQSDPGKFTIFVRLMIRQLFRVNLILLMLIKQALILI